MAGIMDIFGGGVGSSASSSPFANAATPQIGKSGGLAGMFSGGGGGGGNYNAFLDPSGKVPIGRLIGSLMGSPTQAQASGQAMGPAAAKFSQLVTQSGGDSQKALLAFVETPEGADFFANDGDFGKLLTMQQQMMPLTLGPDQGLYSAGGDNLVTAPSEEINAFNNLTAAAGLNPKSPEYQEAAKLAIMSQYSSGQPVTSDKARAAQRLADSGFITYSEMDQLISEEAELREVKNGDTTTGFQIVHKYSEEEPRFVPAITDPGLGTDFGDLIEDPTEVPGGAAPAAPAAPLVGPEGQAPQAAAPPGAAPEVAAAQTIPALDTSAGSGNFGVDPDTGGVDADMLEGAGAFNYVVKWGGGIIGNFFPEMSGGDATRRIAQLQTIEREAQAMLGSGRLLVQTELLKELIQPGTWTGNPVQGAEKMLQFRISGESEAKLELAIYRDSRVPRKQRDEAATNYLNLQRALRGVPPQALLEKTLELFKSRKYGPFTPSGARQALTDLEQNIGEAVTGDLPEFTSDAEVQKAIKNGLQGQFRLNGVLHETD